MAFIIFEYDKYYYHVLKLVFKQKYSSFLVFLSFMLVFSTMSTVYATTTFVDALDTNANDSTGLGLAFNTSGSLMFLSGSNSSSVLEFNCATNFDVSTCTTTGSDDLSVAGEGAIPHGLAFNTAGTKLFIADSIGGAGNTGAILEWSCTAFDVSTCNNNGGADDKDVSGDLTGNATGVAFNTAGTKMFVTDNTGIVFEYGCTAFDVNTCDNNEQADNLSVVGTAATPTDLAFNSDGTKMFVIEDTAGEVNEYTCTTGFDVDTCTFVNVLDISTPEANPGGIAFSTDGLTMFISGSSGGGGAGGGVSEFTLEVAFDLFSSPSTTTTSGSASIFHQMYTKPTFGLSHDYGMMLVEDGFTINGKSFDITNNRHTDFEKQTIPVGKTSTFTAKAYSPNGLQWVEFMFGIPQVGDAHLAEASIQVWLYGNGEVKHVTVNQKNNLINKESVIASSEIVQCTDNSNRKCNSVTVSASFNEAPLYDVFAIKAVDLSRLVQVTFLNKGFEITGDPLNPPEIDYMANGKEGMIEMMRFDKFENLWVDPNGMTYEEYDNLWVSPDGIVYTKNDYNTWIKLSPYQAIEKSSLTNSVMTRIHSDFPSYKQEQLDLASEMMEAYYRTSIDYEESFSEINDIVTTQFSAWSDGPSDLLMEQEISKANAIMEKLCPECGDLSFDKLTDHIFLEYIQVDETIVQAILQQEYLDAVEKFNQRYGNIYNTDIVESVDTISENTSKIDMKELSQIEISKALEIFKQYRNVYGQD